LQTSTSLLVNLISNTTVKNFTAAPRHYQKIGERTAHLEAEGYHVVSVNYAKLNNLKAFQSLARQLSHLIRKRIHIRARKYFENFVALRDLLFKKGLSLRSRFRKIHCREVPQFAGVRIMYRIYLAAWNRLIRHPTSPWY